MSTVTIRVARGAAYLDIHDPGWWREDVPNAISLNELDLGDDASCVLGQRCPLERANRYSEQLHRITGFQGWSSVLEAFAVSYGFTQPCEPRPTQWAPLTREWARVIRARRDGAPQ